MSLVPAPAPSRSACPQSASCALFPLFQSKGIAGLYKLHYCEADHRRCARFELSERGRTVPRHLLPDGSRLRAG